MNPFLVLRAGIFAGASACKVAYSAFQIVEEVNQKFLEVAILTVFSPGLNLPSKVPKSFSD